MNNTPDWTGTCESGCDPRKYTIEQQLELLRSNRSRTIEGKSVKEGDTVVCLNSRNQPIGVFIGGTLVWSMDDR